MPVLKPPHTPVIMTTIFCLLMQIGFALSIFGPAWLSPILSLPALGLITWLWRRAERENQHNRAFTELVI